jgi:hypothetical protein
MPNYDFQALSSYDFELLARDLLQKELKVRLESFGKGRDKGIDFRFRTISDDIVVQCKHYASYDSLVSVLKRDEAQKVSRLKPTRYILAVSTPLTPHRKDEIVALFAPYCVAPADIFGREDLNNLLGIHSDIETKHFKLWLTSEPVLQKILQAGIWGDSELTVERIRNRTSKYVANASLGRAREILDKHHYCIIAGIPGIGKTTLAEILLIDFVDRCGFQAVRIANDLSEIKPVKNPNAPQVFYFDDFLGKTALDKLQKNEDQRLMEFIQEVAENKNWRFLLTTREYILNSARIRYEALANSPADLSPCVIKLSDYTHPIRARILYNHIYFSNLPDAYKRALLEGRRYEKILGHKNYNPRIIEHMTEARNATVLGVTAYFDDFVENLENPTRIWDHAFRNQLSEPAQHLLLVMGSLPNEVLVSDLEIAFNTFYQFRRTKLGFPASSRDFEHALKQLDGNFIKTNRAGEDQIVEFHNPSVNDFIESYLAGSPRDVADLIASATFFDQFIHLLRGRSGTRFSGIDKNSSEFFKALERNFSAPSCAVVLGKDVLGQVSHVRHADHSFESRARFAVEFADSISSPDGRSVVDHLLDLLQDRTRNGQGNKRELVQLLKKIGTRKLSQHNKELLLTARKYLVHSLDDFDDFECLGNFMEAFPQLFEEAELRGIRQKLMHFCDSYDSSWEDDPDWIESFVDTVQEVAAQFDVDLTEFCQALSERAHDLEMRREEQEDEPDDYERDWGERSAPLQEDVSSMFDGLLHEIDERMPS